MTFDPIWDSVHATQKWAIFPVSPTTLWMEQSICGVSPVTKRKDVSVLDLGCAEGAVTLMAARNGFSVVALDGSKEALQKLAGHVKDQGLEDYVTLCHTDAAKIPYPDEHFSAIYDVVCIAHNTNARELVEEVARVTKPNGALYSQIPSSLCPQSRFLEGKGHLSFMDPQEIYTLFAPHFTIKVESFINFFNLPFWTVTGFKCST